MFHAQEGTQDIISVAPLANPAEATEVARVAHLDGFAANGAVSPDGKLLALVVPDAGNAAHPAGSLLVVTLETGKQARLLADIDPQQTPVWANDSGSVVVTTPNASGSQPSGDAAVRFVRVPAAGGTPQTIYQPGAVLGAYAVGFDPGGRFLAVIIDGRGSTLVRDGSELLNLSTQITRDWRLSPDGKQLAFIEADPGWRSALHSSRCRCRRSLPGWRPRRGPGCRFWRTGPRSRLAAGRVRPNVGLDTAPVHGSHRRTRRSAGR